MPTVLELRATVAEIEAAAHAAGARLAQAEVAHNRAARSAISQNDYSGLNAPEAELASARASYDRAAHALSLAREMLREAIEAEREAKRRAARQETESRLDQMAALAAEVDSAFVAFTAKLTELHTLELATYGFVRSALEARPGRAPQALTAARPAAGHLTSLANGLTPTPKDWTAEAIRGVSHDIRLAVQA